jgi:hypothetical protein
MDLEELWAIQAAQGRDARGRDLTIVVPVGDPEFGPYTGYAFASGGGTFPPGYRMLTQEEVSAVRADEEEDPGR